MSIATDIANNTGVSHPTASLAIPAPPTETVDKIAGSSHHHGTESRKATIPVSLSFIAHSLSDSILLILAK